MFSNKVNLLIFVSHYFFKTQGLVKLETKGDDIILITESILRNTTNNLFSELRFDKQVNPRIKQALLVHNFFTSVSLNDHNTLNSIAKLSRVDKNKVNNETEICVKILNEILNEDSNSVEGEKLRNNEDIINNVDEFLKNLNGFKEKNSYNDYEKLDIKDEIIHILKSDNPAQFHPLNRNKTAYNTDDGFLTDNEFWTPQQTRRIFKGERTKVRIFPFMASIQIFKNFQCAGSIIKSDLILTAASCLQLAWNNRFFRENPAFLSVRVGSNFYNGGGEEIPALEVYFQPDYNPKNLRNNIAIIRLRRHLKFLRKKKRVRKIEIDREESPLPMTTDGITVVGWGARDRSNVLGNPYSNQLAFAVLDVYLLEECQDIYSSEYVTRKNFCAGFASKGGGACNRDVGGPGVVNGILAGIISFGSPVCGTPDAPTVFTKVGYYADWIEEVMEQDVPNAYRKTTLSFTYPPTTVPEHLKSTTIRLEPITKWKTLNFNEEDTLRLLEDEELFKEFLSTMFNSKEAEELKDLFEEHLTEKPLNATNLVTVKTNKDKFDISKELKSDQIDDDVLLDYATFPGSTVMGPHKLRNSDDETSEEKVTVISNNIFGSKEQDKELEKNILELIKNIDLDELTTSGSGEEVAKEKNKEVAGNVMNNKRKQVGVTQLDLNILTDEPQGTTTTKMRTTKKMINNKQKRKKKPKKADEVLNLLYMTDDEENGMELEQLSNNFDDFDDDDSEGLEIAADGFQDLTFRSNATQAVPPLQKTISLLDFLSRSELYDLLSEAIEEVSKYKKSMKP